MAKRKKKTCAYCGRQMDPAGSKTLLETTRDHVVPKSRGGNQTIFCCFVCNNLKGDMMPWEWLQYRVANPRWWQTDPRVPTTRFRAGSLLKMNRPPP